MEGVYLEWSDSAGVDGWSLLPENFEPLIIRSIGVLVCEDDNSITIATSCDMQDDPKYDGLLCIPKHAIILRKNMRAYGAAQRVLNSKKTSKKSKVGRGKSLSQK